MIESAKIDLLLNRARYVASDILDLDPTSSSTTTRSSHPSAA
jgi:hypothetical protein